MHLPHVEFSRLYIAQDASLNTKEGACLKLEDGDYEIKYILELSSDTHFLVGTKKTVTNLPRFLCRWSQ